MMAAAMRGIYLPGHALALVGFALALIAAGFAGGLFRLSLGSFVLWGALIGAALSAAAEWSLEAELIGRFWSLLWMAAAVVFVVSLVL